MSEEMFTEKFLDLLPTDPTKALLTLCVEFENWCQTPVEDGEDIYAKYLDAYAAFEAYIPAFGMEFVVPVLEGDEGADIQRICLFVDKMRKALEKIAFDEQFSAARTKYRARFGGGFIYEFSDGDLSRIQELLNELRDEISRSELFDAKHKQRVLNKVESLQRELHKKITSLDKLWGLMSEAGVALGKFGVNAKPIVDRIKEIAQITWRTQARAEELPSGTTFPLLTSSDAEGRDDQ